MVDAFDSLSSAMVSETPGDLSVELLRSDRSWSGRKSVTELLPDSLGEEPDLRLGQMSILSTSRNRGKRFPCSLFGNTRKTE